MSQERRQLEQTRSEVQNAAQSLSQSSTSQALASGTRAQNEFQQLQDDVRRADFRGSLRITMRQMRQNAQQLSQNQQNLENQINDLANNEKLAETDEQRQQRSQIATDWTSKRTRSSNLVDQMRQVSEQSETAELLSPSQLYDTLRRTGLDKLNDALDNCVGIHAGAVFCGRLAKPEQPARTNIDELRGRRGPRGGERSG